MGRSLLEVRDLSKYYINGQNVVNGLNRVSLSFCQGEFVAITGESGSGKSTLAHILGGILPYEDGELYFDGRPTSHYDSADWEHYRRDNVAFISQNYGILPGATVLDNVVSALRLTGMDKTKAAAEAKAILEEVELWDLRRRRAARLSSGQKQRLSIARALAKPCPILIADEPTGNLDPENSDKVIHLLAQAAKQRLVILITHEFSEAQDYVTRHIRVQDGRICADAQLRPVPVSEPQPAEKTPPRDLSFYVTRLQLKSRPVWSAMVLLFFALTAFAVFAFLGSFIVALDDTPTRIYQSDAFLNGDTKRIVAVRKDQQTFTQEDYDKILSIDHVDRLERFGYVADIIYGYREDIDYVNHYSLRNYGTRLDPLYIQTSYTEVRPNGLYVQTIPLMAGGIEFISAGRLPENVYEVVAAGSKAQIGQTVSIYLRNSRSWRTSEYIKLDVTVVGVTDIGSGYYFHEDLGAALNANYVYGRILCIPYYADIPSHVRYQDYFDATTRRVFLTEVIPMEDSVMRPLADDEVLISLGMYCTLWPVSAEVDGVIVGSSATVIGDSVYNIAGVHESTLENLYCVSPAFFRSYISGYEASDQVSITIRDYSYTDRVISDLEAAGYYALSPYVRGSTAVDEALAEERIQTLWVCLGAMAVVILLQLIVLRALFGMENDSYRILSNIGLTYRAAGNSILLQILMFALLGQLLGISAILICSYLGVERIVNLTKYLYAPYWAALSLVHLAASMIAGAGVIGNVKKSIYPMSGRRSDLSLDEISGEVAL